MECLISIVVPVYNESVKLQIWHQRLLRQATKPERLEVIFVEAGDVKEDQFESTEPNCCYFVTDNPQRARQMNLGASKGSGDIIYFLHIDSLPPKDFDKHIRLALEDKFAGAGCFRLQFDWAHPLLKFYAYFSRFKATIFHGGDASLFIRRSLFKKVHGYNENLTIMEDYDLINRLKPVSKFIVLKDSVLTSARKYKSKGVLKLQWHFFIIHLLYGLKYSQYVLLNYYRKYVL